MAKKINNRKSSKTKGPILEGSTPYKLLQLTARQIVEAISLQDDRQQPSNAKHIKKNINHNR